MLKVIGFCTPAARYCTAALLAILFAAESPADEPDYGRELPRIAAREPIDALLSFRLASDALTIEQVAAEPLVTSPVALDFDADGRMFVVEMRDYSEQDNERLGRIRLLEDTDNDGRFDKATIFAADLSWPTAIACANGGVFVGAAPHIYFLKDDDGDGVADTKRIVFTGFNRDNVQGLLNSFQWGLDNRLHGATSTAGGEVHRADDQNARSISLRGRDFSIDTRTLNIEPESGGGQHGMTFDDWGRKFVSSNSDHIQLILAEDRYLARNSFLAAPPPRASIAADGPQAEVFRISPVEPWRILRTRLRVAGKVPGPIEGGGRPAGYFTGATGVTIYRGNAWPEEFRGNAFIGDVGSNIVHRKTLSADGLLLIAKRADEHREFLASTDIWFRPAQFANAPDGNLYVIDVYREVIEHPASLPPEIKKHLDLTSGRDRGRIYRIRPKEFKHPDPIRLNAASTAELVKLLEHPNGWHRETASRLLYERNDKSAVPLLISLARTSKSPLGRMHALRALAGLESLSKEVLVKALSDEHPAVRCHAVQLAETHLNSPVIREALFGMATDPDLLVRYQLAFTLGELHSDDRLTPLAQLAKHDAAQPWMRIALQSSLADGAAQVFGQLAADGEFRRSDPGRLFLVALARQIGAKSREQDMQVLDHVLAVLESSREDAQVLSAIAVALVQATANARGTSDSSRAVLSRPSVTAAMKQAVSQAKAIAIDSNRPSRDRTRAVETLQFASINETHETFARLIRSEQPPDVQLAAITCLSRSSEEIAISLVLEKWPSFTPRMRAAAIEGLLSKRSSIERLFSAIEKGEVARADIDPARVAQLLRHNDFEIAKRTRAVFGTMKQTGRDEIVRSYQNALHTEGSPDRGRVVFRTTCAGCHKAEGQGHELGPNLATVQNRGAEAILLNILDPNREVNPQFVNYVVVTKDGRTASGIIAGESSAGVTLKRAEGQSDTILRSEIEELSSTGASLMPEGMEKQIDVPAMADLLAYLNALK